MKEMVNGLSLSNMEMKKKPERDIINGSKRSSIAPKCRSKNAKRPKSGFLVRWVFL